MLNFQNLVVMAKIPKVTFHGMACPGDTLIYEARILDGREDGGIVEVSATKAGTPLAESEFVFACLASSGSKTACQENFLKTMQVLGLNAAPGGQTETRPN